MADIEDGVIQATREAVQATPEGHPDRALYSNELSIQLGNRYSRTGAIIDLREAIQIGQEAVKATPEDHPDRVWRLSSLQSLLEDRYSETEAIADLEESINIGRVIVEATPEDHPDRAWYISNLGSLLARRYSETGAIADLEEFLNYLGIALGAHYSRTGAMADLEEAIQIGQDVVETTPKDHPDRPVYLNNLGTRLGSRFSKTAAMSDLEEAIRVGLEAVGATSEAHPDRALYLHNLGTLLSDRSSRTGQQAYKSAATTVHLIPRLTLRSLENSDKQHLLGEVVGFASNAAAVALNAQKGALVALDLLELGRGVLAASLKEVRADIQDLHHTYPTMAEKFIQLQAILDKPTPYKKAHARQRANADRELDKLIVNIRKQPGFNNFFQAPSEKEMRDTAQKGPIVTINISRYRCDAILLERDKIHVLPLSGVSSREIEEKAKYNDLESPAVLAWLWDSIMDPILQALGFTHSPSDCNWPHVWWISTGPLIKFPLHAAGYHNQGRSRTVLDRVMSSYSSSSSSPHALLIAMEHTPGSDQLPFAAKEVRILHEMCDSMGLHSIEPKRHKHDIISLLEGCRIFHFAGHGYTDHADPSKSQLILEDGGDNSLTVASLLEMNLRKHTPFLAYLSACGTGKIKDQRFMDESIHLISAFQLAGFRHVIGTLWNVNDEICVDMASITYKGMIDGQMDDESVCRGLHQATREMRDRWLYASSRSRHQSKPARNASHSSSLPRDIIPTDTETGGDGVRTQALWVPYVHFGV
ncbi:CHAT domain-containing protein [Aspergillus oleicola]